MNYNEKIAYDCELLLNWALKKELITSVDTNYARNLLIATVLLDKPYDGKVTECPDAIAPVLEDILDNVAADCERSPLLLPDNTVTFRDLLDTAIMGAVTPWPSEVVRTFLELEKKSAVDATNYFYQLALNTNYIRSDRVARNKIWAHKSPYADLTITINLTKPEKDPKEIAKLKSIPASGYPKCLLCPQNEGYKGTANNPARQNHRLIPLTLNNESWSLQYSPYVYYNEHCIVLRNEHVPMKIEHDSFVRLLDFCQRFPHYFIGSNADLPIVGGSILTHDHFQGGNHVMPMFTSREVEHFKYGKFPNSDICIINWPMSTLKLTGKDPSELAELAFDIHSKWKEYSAPDHGIIAYSGETRHNTTTPIVRKEGDMYALYLVLRNNRTSAEHPDGIFHPHQQWHHIKKENIGLIEVMGYFILPGRLATELKILADAMVENKLDLITSDSPAYKHVEWAKEILSRRNVTAENAIDVIHEEVGTVCTHVLEDSGVFKTDSKGIKGFEKFVTECVIK